MSTLETFSPLRDLARQPSRKPRELATVNLRALTPFQRALLVIDGTVTKFIEAYKLEPVEIHCLRQQREALAEPDEWLEAAAGTEVILRQVLIRGEFSRELYVYAVSRVAIGRLPSSIASALEKEGAGLGRLLNETSLETRREILWFGKGALDDPPRPVAQAADGEFLSRTYRIVIAGKPVALLQENFPAGTSSLPSHV